jgi:hypothetical protein
MHEQTAELLATVLGQDESDPGLRAVLTDTKLGAKRLRRDDTQLAYLTYRKHGVDLLFREQPIQSDRAGSASRQTDRFILSAAMFHRDGHEGYRGFTGPLPLVLSFNWSRGIVRATLGAPTESGCGIENEFFGDQWPHWDCYQREYDQVTVQYAGNGGSDASVELVTIERIECS